MNSYYWIFISFNKHIRIFLIAYLLFNTNLATISNCVSNSALLIICLLSPSCPTHIPASLVFQHFRHLPSCHRLIDELFSLYHFTPPLKNNSHVLPLPHSITHFPSVHRPFFLTIYPPHFGSFQGPPLPKFDGNDPPAGCLNRIYDFFDFYSTPLHEQPRLLRICWSGNASRWLQWMRANVLLHQPKIPVVASSSSAPWIELPGDVTANILQRLGRRVYSKVHKKCVLHGGRFPRIPTCGKS